MQAPSKMANSPEASNYRLKLTARLSLAERPQLSRSVRWAFNRVITGGAKSDVNRRHKPTADYFRTLGWVLTLLYLFLILFALAAGRIIGLDNTFWVCIGIATITTVIFASIIALNMLVIAVIKILNYCHTKKLLA